MQCRISLLGNTKKNGKLYSRFCSSSYHAQGNVLADSNKEIIGRNISYRYTFSCHRALCLTDNLLLLGLQIWICENIHESIRFHYFQNNFVLFIFNLGTSTSLGMARRMDKLDHWGHSEVRKRSPREITPKISQEYSNDISRWWYRWSSESGQSGRSTSKLWRYWKRKWKSYWATITFRKCVHDSSH